jgi:hypothetical protein
MTWKATRLKERSSCFLLTCAKPWSSPPPRTIPQEHCCVGVTPLSSMPPSGAQHLNRYILIPLRRTPPAWSARSAAMLSSPISRSSSPISLHCVERSGCPSRARRKQWARHHELTKPPALLANSDSLDAAHEVSPSEPAARHGDEWF